MPRLQDPPATATRRQLLIRAGSGLLALLGAGGAGAYWERRRSVLFRDGFDRPDGLVSNEFAYDHPQDTRAARSPDWAVTSGSFFRRAGHGWTGVPDTGVPDPLSRTATNSDVLRMVTVRGFHDVRLRFRLRVDRFEPGGEDWSGVHVFLRYRDEFSLYVVSVARQDGMVAVKKKVPGGNVNGGTYVGMGSAVRTPPLGRWEQVEVTVADDRAAVVIALRLDGRAVLRVRDAGDAGEPLTGSGRLGLRGDRCEFEVDDLEVTRI